jgi:hypothetical protein
LITGKIIIPYFGVLLDDLLRPSEALTDYDEDEIIKTFNLKVL